MSSAATLKLRSLARPESEESKGLLAGDGQADAVELGQVAGAGAAGGAGKAADADAQSAAGSEAADSGEKRPGAYVKRGRSVSLYVVQYVVIFFETMQLFALMRQAGGIWKWPVWTMNASRWTLFATIDGIRFEVDAAGVKLNNVAVSYYTWMI